MDGMDRVDIVDRSIKKILAYNLTLSNYSLKRVKFKISIIIWKTIQEIVRYFQKMDRLDILDRLEYLNMEI